MGIEKIDFKKCSSCGTCAKICPMDVIRMDDASGYPVVKYFTECMCCFLCETNCPEEAIYVTPDRVVNVPTAWSDLASRRVGRLNESG